MSKCERKPTAAMDGTDDVWQTCDRCGACWSGLKGDWVPLYCVDRYRSLWEKLLNLFGKLAR